MVSVFIRRVIADLAGRIADSCFIAYCAAASASIAYEAEKAHRPAEIFYQRAMKLKARHEKWTAIKRKYQVRESGHDRPEK